MSNPIAHRMQIAAWHTLQATRGESVQYFTRTGQSIQIDLAVLTQPKTARLQTTDSTGFESRRWEWLIGPSDLALPDGTLIVPAHGHWIIRDKDTTKFVLSPNDKDLVWRWSDASQIWRRVYTEEVT
jgi:hypothetical protein